MKSKYTNKSSEFRHELPTQNNQVNIIEKIDISHNPPLQKDPNSQETILRQQFNSPLFSADNPKFCSSGERIIKITLNNIASVIKTSIERFSLSTRFCR